MSRKGTQRGPSRSGHGAHPPKPTRRGAASERRGTAPDRDGFLIGVHAAIAVLQHQPQRVRAVYCWSRDPRVLASLRAAGADRLVAEPPGDLGQDHLAQGVAVEVRPFPYLDLDELLSEAPATGASLLLVLDSITDTRNLGAILRSAAFFGVAGVVIGRDRAAEVTPVAERIARGGASLVPVAQVTNLARSLRTLAEAGWWTVGTSLEVGTRSIWELAVDRPIALVLGAEDKGLRPLVAKHCDHLVHLPGAPEMQSLNVAAFATAALAVLRRP